MNWRLEGLDQSIIMEYLVGGQPVVPDADSVSMKAWSHDGTLLFNEPYTSGLPPTQAEVVLTGAMNQLGSLSLFENRFVRVDFKYESKPYFAQTSYRLHRMIPMTADAQSVRRLVAADYEELNDEDADVISAYFELYQSFGPEFALALLKTNRSSIAANDAIALKAAIKLCPSMQSRLLKLEKENNAGYQRATMDFDKLRADLEAQLIEALGIISVEFEIVEPTTVAHTLFAVVNQTDRITNS